MLALMHAYTEVWVQIQEFGSVRVSVAEKCVVCRTEEE